MHSQRNECKLNWCSDIMMMMMMMICSDVIYILQQVDSLKAKIDTMMVTRAADFTRIERSITTSVRNELGLPIFVCNYAIFSRITYEYRVASLKAQLRIAEDV